MIDLVPLGDRAYLARFPAAAEARAWASAARAAGISGVVDVVLAYRSVAVFADPERADFTDLELRLRALSPSAEVGDPGNLVRLPVLYDGEDLPEVARRLGLTPGQVIAEHSSRDYSVFAIGFLPGFPYAGYLPDTLSGLARRDVPRTRVPAGSVAIVGRQTGVYPGESPGGWHLIGRTVLPLVDVSIRYFPIRAGDRLRFGPVDAQEFADRQSAHSARLAGGGWLQGWFTTPERLT